MSRLTLRRPEFLGLLSSAATPPPTLYLDGEGVAIADKSPSGRTLAVGAGATISTAQAATGASSIDFNNSDTSRIGVTPAISIPSNQGFTIECMVRPRSLPVYSTLLEVGNHGTNTGIAFFLNNVSTGPCIYNNGFFGATPTPIPLNIWTKLRYVITTEGANRRVYIYRDDVLVANAIIPSGRNFSGTNTIAGINAVGLRYYVDGFMDELRIWSEALLLS